ncbi:FeoB-associated Cys-rich membrane protein [Pseudomonas sp. SWRI79]|uniref:FeoB-associated Cys-rich membrane protein n=1 Tax=Pseudomonas farris TaxID=2841207 RepID=A0ABS6PZK2_9PSED|nr:FeoB-associated Cys-rich membrane protein [Pseudomonas farris]
MTMGFLAQYGVIAILLVVAVVSLWRRLAPSRTGGCDSGCGSCSSGCKPAQRIPVRTVTHTTAQKVESNGCCSPTMRAVDK